MHYSRSRGRLLYRARHAFVKGAQFFGIQIGVIATVFGILQAGAVTFEMKHVATILTVSLLVSVGYALVRSRLDHLPDEIILCDETDKSYELDYEDKQVCGHFNQETAKYFGRDFVDDAVVESWRNRNPHAFIYLRNAAGEPCAAACIFALNPSFMEQFVRGKVSETDLDPEDVCDIAASRKSSALYIPAIIVDRPHTQLGHRRAIVMVWGIVKYLRKSYGTRKKRVVYAVPINRASKNLLKRLGFKLVGPAKMRKDRHDLYAFEMTASSIAGALARIGDHSACCKVVFNPKRFELRRDGVGG